MNVIIESFENVKSCENCNILKITDEKTEICSCGGKLNFLRIFDSKLINIPINNKEEYYNLDDNDSDYELDIEDLLVFNDLQKKWKKNNLICSLKKT